MVAVVASNLVGSKNARTKSRERRSKIILLFWRPWSVTTTTRRWWTRWTCPPRIVARQTHWWTWARRARTSVDSSRTSRRWPRRHLCRRCRRPTRRSTAASRPRPSQASSWESRFRATQAATLNSSTSVRVLRRSTVGSVSAEARRWSRLSRPAATAAPPIVIRLFRRPRLA